MLQVQTTLISSCFCHFFKASGNGFTVVFACSMSVFGFLKCFKGEVWIFLHIKLYKKDISDHLQCSAALF